MLVDQLEYHAKIETAIQHAARPPASCLTRRSSWVQQDEELKRKLYHALQQLTPRQKELIDLMFFEGYSYQQIASHTS